MGVVYSAMVSLQQYSRLTITPSDKVESVLEWVDGTTDRPGQAGAGAPYSCGEADWGSCGPLPSQSPRGSTG
ncbi:hypothetical protein SKAU_G00166340 [Synaphobranchus kaupii]|uniref:Uncharacterized protein n=1 Tax=Synaphobranchus kaupii TaxID=118154 RepID=A0A9Q1FJI1_SYNKA|nr:hypothetical protein SKAU_G00166340 [Synaphobranchus kaupii]